MQKLLSLATLIALTGLLACSDSASTQLGQAPAGTTFTDADGNVITEASSDTVVQIRDANGNVISSFTVGSDANLSNLAAGRNSSVAFAHFPSTAGLTGTVSLYVPCVATTNTVYVTPGAATASAVSKDGLGTGVITLTTSAPTSGDYTFANAATRTGTEDCIISAPASAFSTGAAGAEVTPPVDNCAAGCDTNATCVSDSSGNQNCRCNANYFGDGTTCTTHPDECSPPVTDPICGANATCANTEAGHECTCDTGYTGDGITCTDLDECAIGRCDPLTSCTNSVGSFSCTSCPAGYNDVNGDGTKCVDYDECDGEGGGNSCSSDAVCTNTEGSYSCACKSGFDGSGYECNDIDECGGGMFLSIGPPQNNCDSNAACFNTTGSYECVCRCGFSGDGTTCQPSESADCACDTVEFSHEAGSKDQDCITPDICITRNEIQPIYNSVTERSYFDGNLTLKTKGGYAPPTGTLWATYPCDSAPAYAFTDFLDSVGGFESARDVLNYSNICLWLPEQNLKYDVNFTDWGQNNNGSFGYTRTAFVPDNCRNGLARCGQGDCNCPTGTVQDPLTGKCEMLDPCNPSPCAEDAICRREGLYGHRCECGTVDFFKPKYETSTVDRLSGDVLIARDDYAPLYNSLLDSGSGGCYSPTPTGTSWSDEPCDNGGGFGGFVGGFVGCEDMDSIYGRHGCVQEDATGEKWDVQMSHWCRYGDGGCFGYLRWKSVQDGEGCN